MKDDFELRLARLWPPEEWREVTVLVAVSGGPDSLALLRGLRTLKTGGAGRLVAAHVNHQLRGSESDEDERFVRQQCESLGLPCEVGKAPVAAIADEQGDGIEAAARQARYAFLTEAAHRVGARFVATGHTADDQAETILHRILRGTGIAGLAGSPRTRALSPATTLIRPMLTVRRAEVLAYLDRLGQAFREDRTNIDPRFTRNRIRHELLPHLAAIYNPGVVDALLRLGSIAAEYQQAIVRRVKELFDVAVEIRPVEIVVIRKESLRGVPRYVTRELFVAVWRHQGWPEQAMGQAEWNRLGELLELPEAGTAVLPGNVTVQADDDELRLTRRGPKSCSIQSAP